MRIISGYLKGKRILLPKDKLTRPLKDMVKESIFNIIEHSNDYKINIKNSVILDLFSGSGSFGLECISRGADKVTFNENYEKAIEILEKNIQSFDCENKCQILKTNCFDLNRYYSHKVNLIFIDPPFKENNINELIELVYKMKILDGKGIIIIHRKKKFKETFIKKLKILDVRYYGLSKIIFAKF